jgi:hypothetical protein
LLISIQRGFPLYLLTVLVINYHFTVLGRPAAANPAHAPTAPTAAAQPVKKKSKVQPKATQQMVTIDATDHAWRLYA